MKVFQNTKLITFITFLLIIYIYLVNIPYYYNFDGTVFSNFLRYAILKSDIKLVLQPHHLLYTPLSYISYKILSITTGYNLLEYFHLQLISFFFGILSLLFIYKIFKALRIDNYYRLTGLFFIAFSFLFWISSTDAEVHMPGLFFIISGIYFLFHQRLNLRNIIISSLLFSLSAGFHITNTLIIVSILLFFILNKVKIKKIIQFYFFYSIFISLPFLLLKIFYGINIIKVIIRSIFGDAVSGYTGYKLERWYGFSINSLLRSINSIKKSILISNPQVLSIISFFLFLGIFIVIIYSFKKNSSKKIYCYYIFWILPFLAFFSFWQPWNYEFKLSIVVPILIMFVFSLNSFDFQKIVKPLFFILVILIFLLNFYNYIKPQKDINNNKNYLISKEIKTKTDQNSTIVIAGTGKGAYIFGKIYIPYFAQRRTLILNWLLGNGYSFQDIAKKIDNIINEGNKVYFLSEITSLTETMKDILILQKLKEDEFLEFLKKFKFKQRIEILQNHFISQIEKVN